MVTAFEAFFRNPRSAEVYNLGGGRFSNTSHLEAFALAEKITGNEMITEYVEAEPGRRPQVVDRLQRPRSRRDYPDWKQATTCR